MNEAQEKQKETRSWWQRWLEEARTREQLRGLSDHLLKDIGLERTAIDARFR
jgi:uncharacterized protein YjiS (DUF1127 family)